MKTISYILFVFLMGTILLTACGGSVKPVEATPVLAGTKSAYPVPVQKNTPVGYPAASQPDQPNAAAAYPADGIVLQVVKADGQVVSLDFKGLAALAKQNVTLDNKQVNVSKLSDTLSLAGISAPNKVTLTGTSGQLELSKDQVAQAYLDVTANGTIRLLVQGVPPDKWLTGVSGIKVE